MKDICIYWDNSNIFIEAKRLSKHLESAPDVRYRVRIEFENLFRLACADRLVKTALVAGSVPPELRQLWYRMEKQGLEVDIYDRGESTRGEQEIPDRILQFRMFSDALKYNGDPGVVVLLTGDGAGYQQGAGFHVVLEQMHKKGWRIEVLSWEHSCNPRMQQWAKENGLFIAIDDYYEAITYLEPSRPGHKLAQSRDPAELDLSKRQLSD